MIINPSREQVREFHELGYTILKSYLNGGVLLEVLQREIEELGRSFSSAFRFDSAEAISRMGEPQRTLMYRALRYLPSLASLSSSEDMQQIGRALGISFPALMRSYNVRMDMPEQDQFLFHWHQDITYLLGSRNSVTFWVPLGPADKQHGTIEVIPQSHGSIAPFFITSKDAFAKTAQLSPNDVRLVEEPKEPGILIEAERGDVVVFSQLLLHRSTPNRSSRPRWTIQIRYSDLADSHFREHGFPFGDMTTVLKTHYLGEWTSLGEQVEDDK